MPAIIKKYPLYVSDEPVTYQSFVGGINTDPSNEHVLPNELRDALNVHYQSGGIVKRKGAKILSTILSTEDIKNVQGVSLFTNKLTYLIIAADGKLFYGIYTPNTEINVTMININFYPYNRAVVHDPLNVSVGLQKYKISQVPTSLTHEGYVVEKENNISYIGEYYSLPNNTVIFKNNYFLKDNKFFTFVGNDATFSINITFILPTNTNFWRTLTTLEKNTIGTNQLNNLAEWSSQSIRYSLNQIVKYTVGEVVEYYICKTNHNVRGNIEVENSGLFLETPGEQESLIFQNYKRIEGATFNNKLYLATGTRIVEVYPDSSGELLAYVVSPKAINAIVFTTIGPNNLSPYPEFCLQTEKDQAITSISALLPLYSSVDGNDSFVLRPIMTLAGNEEISEYYFRWEKFVDNQWKVLVRFEDNFFNTLSFINGRYENTSYRIDRSFLVVNDANEYKYRVTFAKSFEVDVTPTATTSVQYTSEELLDINNQTVVDFKINKVDGSFFGQASSVIYDINVKPSQLFKVIQSCTKVLGDGNKFLFYDDAYNSGESFKTVIDNPNYITLRGGLSFKTNKNESLVKMISFAGNIIAFANSANVGGSIHLVLGNGDDVESDRFYSPYRRKTISPNVSCDNPYTVQVAENLLFFKHFNTVYFIQASELDQERVTLYSANDKIKVPNRNFVIPWEDNNCISEVTEDYYALMWPEKTIVENGEPIVVYPATRIKLYYKTYQNVQGKIFFPWLRDESNLFNIKHLFYINSKPIYLYNNTLVTMSDTYHKDFDDVYECFIRLKAYDLEKPKMFKMLDNVTLFYNRNQYSDVDIEMEGVNEAGHKIIEWKNKPLVQDRKTLAVGDLLNKTGLKLDSTLIDSKVINSVYRFPFLLVEVIIKSKSEKDFSFSSITFNYTTVDIPDQNPYGLYKDIVRKGDDFRVVTKDSTLLESVREYKHVENGLSNEDTIPRTINRTNLYVSEEAPIVILYKDDIWYDI